MNCSEVEATLPEIARSDDVNPVLRKRVLLHARSCMPCARQFADQRYLTDLLSDLQVETQSEAASPAVEAALLAEFRRRNQTERPATVSRPVRFASPAKWLLAAAAVLAVFVLIVLALKLSSSKQLTTQPQQVRETTQPSAPEETRNPNPATPQAAKANETVSPAPEKKHNTQRTGPSCSMTQSARRCRRVRRRTVTKK